MYKLPNRTYNKYICLSCECAFEKEADGNRYKFCCSKCASDFRKGKKSSHKITEETKKKISETLKKNPIRYWLGKNFSPSHREKLKESHLGDKGSSAWNWKGGTHACVDCGAKSKDYYSERCRECCNKWRVGENHPQWRGGITPENARIRASAEYKLWRISVFERDDYTCVFCMERGGILHADHIKQFAYYPDLRLEKDNGRTLCIDCHKKTDTYLRRSKDV